MAGAAKINFEPRLTDAARCTKVSFSSNCELVYAIMLDSNCSVIDVASDQG